MNVVKCMEGGVDINLDGIVSKAMESEIIQIKEEFDKEIANIRKEINALIHGHMRKEIASLLEESMKRGIDSVEYGNLGVTVSTNLSTASSTPASDGCMQVDRSDWITVRNKRKRTLFLFRGNTERRHFVRMLKIG